MSEGFQIARLIPVSGIANAVEAETRATSALLAVLRVVRDLSSAITAPLGASSAKKATVEAFIETKFKLNSGAVVRPDGLIQVTYGSSTWRALVEVKTGSNDLEAEQCNNYLTVAREQGLDAVITISNQIGVGRQHPCAGVRVRANSKIRLAHYSWTEILAFAVRAKVHHGVEDPEQAWILGELIRYLEHPASGAMALEDMGPNWVAVRDAGREGSLRKTGDDVLDIVERWDRLMRFAALRLGADTGVDVQHVVPRSQSEPRARLNYLIDSLVSAGTLDGTLRVPGAVGTVTLTADLRARQAAAFSDIGAPADRGNKARITWLVRQLAEDAPPTLVLEAWVRNTRQPLAATLAQVRGSPELLLDPEKRDLARFRILLRTEMGSHRKDGGRSPGFIQSVTSVLDRFYESVLQRIVAPPPKAPQARAVPRPPGLVDEPLAPGELDQAIAAAQGKAATEVVEADPVPPSADDPSSGADELERLTSDDFVEATPVGTPLESAGEAEPSSDPERELPRTT